MARSYDLDHNTSRLPPFNLALHWIVWAVWGPFASPLAIIGYHTGPFELRDNAMVVSHPVRDPNPSEKVASEAAENFEDMYCRRRSGTQVAAVDAPQHEFHPQKRSDGVRKRGRHRNFTG